MMTPLEPVTHFAKVANRFCRWCEALPAGESAAMISISARRALADLYSAVLSIPDVYGDFAIVESEDPPLPPKPLPQLASLPFELYNTFYNPSSLDESPSMGDLFDDFQDIYRDLRTGLALYERRQVEAAAWHWHFSFRTHWGHHAVSAIFALETYEA